MVRFVCEYRIPINVLILNNSTTLTLNPAQNSENQLYTQIFSLHFQGARDTDAKCSKQRRSHLNSLMKRATCKPSCLHNATHERMKYESNL